MTLSNSDVQDLIRELRSAAAQATSEAEVREVTSRIAALTRAYRIQNGIGIPGDPLEQSQGLDKLIRTRPHLEYLSQRIAAAVRDVERGRNRMLAVSMPPRAGKSTLLSLHTPTWLLRRHPEWKIVLGSHDGDLSGGWARSIRTTIEENPGLGIALAKDGGAGTKWSTEERGGMYSVSVPRGNLIGHGARVMIIDDPVKDFVDAHSINTRQALWDWWLSVALTRLEPPYLVLVVMTRWHEDDFVGRLLSDEYEGDSRAWEKIALPALAGKDDPIGRRPGEPLLSPLLDETPDEAVVRWNDLKNAVGTYTFSAMYQQEPAPSQGAIFDMGWWRFWTRDPAKATEDGRVVYLDPSSLSGGRWLDSWDCAFKGSETASDYVVGQRWVRYKANRYLIAQQRGRWTFTQTIEKMEQWAGSDPYASPCGHFVHQRLIEEKANGSAIIDTLRDKISGLKPVNPRTSKESRARAHTPEIESGNVYLPHPSDPGNEWVDTLLSELRNFPNDMHDDQVDTLTQALGELREEGRGLATVPGRGAPGLRTATRNTARAAYSDLGKYRTRR